MKLRNIAKKNGKAVNLTIKGVGTIMANAEFEVEDAKAKELLTQKISDNAIVEKVKEEKKDKEV